jgi:type I restriction enzyme S subunit
MGYRAYPEYKESGVEWFRNIPSDWTVHRLKMLASEPLKYGANEAADLEDPSLPRFIRITDVNSDGSLNPDTFRSLPEKTAEPYLLEDGDILLARSGATVGKSFIYSPEWGKAAYAGYLIRLRTDKHVLHKRFAYYFFQSSPYWANIDSELIQATIQNFSAEKYSTICIPTPDLNDQVVITQFLDHKTAQIDRLIEKKQELIEKLQEQIATAATQAITKGLGNINLKPSGIAWLEQTPEHWALLPLKFIATIGNGSTPARDNADYWSANEIPWLNSSNVNKESVNSSDQFVTDMALLECHLPLIEPPAILVGITGQGRTRGMATLLKIKATINQHLAYIKPVPGVLDVDFLLHVLTSAYQFLRSESDGGGSTKGAITCEQLANLKIPVPPIAEQKLIADLIASHLKRSNASIEKAETAIDRLQEYRTALITATITGQVDVRDIRKEQQWR